MPHMLLLLIFRRQFPLSKLETMYSLNILISPCQSLGSQNLTQPSIELFIDNANIALDQTEELYLITVTTNVIKGPNSTFNNTIHELLRSAGILGEWTNNPSPFWWACGRQCRKGWIGRSRRLVRCGGNERMKQLRPSKKDVTSQKLILQD